MKRLFQLLSLLMFSISSPSQSLSEKLSGVLYQVGKDIPSDQLFLHLDRNLYHPGDTIRFQAYIRDSRTGVFGTESISLYVLIINSEHVTIDSARFRIIYPAVPGWLVIPDKIQPGDYSVLTFTSSDINFNPKYAFSTPVKIDNLIPSGNTPKQKVEIQDTARYQVPLQEQSIDLRFLPEGGTFIYGIKQRVAFNAVTSTGSVLEVSGEIKNQEGVSICDFKSSPNGSGVAEFTPQQGDTYFASISDDKSGDMKWPLPAAEKSGVSMRVINRGDRVIDIILRGRNIEGRSYFLTVTMNNVLVFSEDVKVDTLFRKRIQTDKLPSGTAYISLYDNELNPVAERLVFLNDYKKMNVKIEVSAPFFFKGEETELTVTTTDEAGDKASSVISVAVIDSAFGYCSSIIPAEIESTYLYDREFYDNLPRRIKYGGLKFIDSKSMDLLLMTYGWRKFVPKEVAVTPDMELVNYDYLKIINPGPVKNGRSEISLISDASLDVISLPVSNKREAILYYDSLDFNVRQIMILPDKTPDKNINPVRISFPENKDYTERVKLLANFPTSITPDLPFSSIKQTDLRLDGYIIIEPVTIKAPIQPVKPKEYVDRYARMYQSSGAQTWYRKDFGPAFCLEDILYKYNPYKLHDFQVFLRPSSPYISGENYGPNEVFHETELSYPALIVVDSNPIGYNYETVATMSSSQIASVTFLRGVQGVTMYGAKARGGVVFITTIIGSGFTEEEFDKMEEARRNDDQLQQVRLFRTETEFYIPAKEKIENDPAYQFRPTIFWQDLVFIDESGTVKIKYHNNLVISTVLVFVNGISFTNLIGSDRLSYEVK
jgi:alpha-2-macroglobulin-like protein